jgi:hypothetical protein
MTSPAPFFRRLTKANWLGRYLDVERDFDDKLKGVLVDALSNINDAFGNLSDEQFSQKVRRQQIATTGRTLRGIIHEIFGDTGNLIRDHREDAAVAAVDAQLYDQRGILARIFKDPVARDQYASSLQQTARRNIDAVVTRVLETEKPLSARVYNSESLAKGQVSLAINRALARGASARDLANDVKALIDPKVPGGVSYAARRLGRTELNNAFHAQSIHDAQTVPWVGEMRWHLSKVHEKDPGDPCEDYARIEMFPADKVPEKPHPNCRCFVTPEQPKYDDFEDALLSGEYDKFLEDVLGPESKSLKEAIPQQYSDRMQQAIAEANGGDVWPWPGISSAQRKEIQQYNSRRAAAILAEEEAPKVAKPRGTLLDKTIPKSLEAAKNPMQVQNWLENEYTGLDVVGFTSDMNTESVKELASTFVTLHEQYPRTGLNRLRIGELLDEHGDAESINAETNYDGRTGDMEVVFNEFHMQGSHADFAKRRRDSEKDKWVVKSPAGMGPVEATLTHEWGHVLDLSGKSIMSRELNPKNAPRGSKVTNALFDAFDPSGELDPNDPDARKRYEAWVFARVPSDYSWKDKSKKIIHQDEIVAEAYAATKFGQGNILTQTITKRIEENARLNDKKGLLRVLVKKRKKSK